MKLILIITLIISATAQAEPAKILSAELLKGVSADVKKDDSAFRKTSPFRAPASVDASPNEILIEEQKSQEKIQRNLNQLGKPSW